MAYSIAIASGKGGVGKTTLAVNLALSMKSNGERCVLLDADLGMANSHILLGVNPQHTVADVIEGRKSVNEIIIDAPLGLKFLSGGTGLTDMLNLDNQKRTNLIRNLDQIENQFDHLLIDVGAGAEDSSLSMIEAADRVLVVLVSEPTSFMDAFALIKAAHIELGTKEFCIAFNMSKSELEAQQNFEKFRKIVLQFYDVNLKFVGSIPNSSIIRQSITKRKPAVLGSNNQDIKHAFKTLYGNIIKSNTNQHAGIQFFSNNKVKKIVGA